LVIDLTKIESGKFELALEPFDVRHCIESAMDVVAVRALAQGLDLIYDAPASVPVVAVADVTRVRQILTNLLGNAVKFTAKGEVVVTVESTRLPAPIDMASSSSKDYLENKIPSTNGRHFDMHELHFAVRDTGIGIPIERAHRLFQIFSQVNTDTSKNYGGTGLGLAISRQFAEMMGGEIWVESEASMGSTFHFTIRVPCSYDSPPQWLTPKVASLMNRVVWIMDPSDTIRNQLSQQLSYWGCTVLTLSDADDLLKRLDLCQSDISLPATNNPTLTITTSSTTSTTRSLPDCILLSLQLRLGGSRSTGSAHNSPRHSMSSSSSSTGSPSRPNRLAASSSLRSSPSGVGSSRTLAGGPSHASSSHSYEDGVTVARRIREHQSKSLLPIVLMCALSERKQDAKMVVNAFGTKPVKPGQLLQALVSAIRDRSNFEQHQQQQMSNPSSIVPVSPHGGLGLPSIHESFGISSTMGGPPSPIPSPSSSSSPMPSRFRNALDVKASPRFGITRRLADSPSSSSSSSLSSSSSSVIPSVRASPGRLSRSLASSKLLSTIAAAPSHVPRSVPLKRQIPKVEAKRPLSILVAEDNAVNQKVIRQMLKMQVHTCSIPIDYSFMVDRVCSFNIVCVQ
jgi:CheY-like chemotaxis protein